jgi:terminase large subunit-like protein
VTTVADDLRYSLDRVAWSVEVLKLRPDPWQAAVLRSEAPRMLLNCSRQSGKTTTSRVLVTHTAVYQPGALVLLISPSLRQSGEAFRGVEALVRLAGAEVVESTKLSLALGNGSRVVSLPASEDTIRGYAGVTLVVEDEAARVEDSLYFSVRPMLAVSGGRLVLASTPAGRRGHFSTAWHDEPGWERTCITADQCPRIPQTFLDQERRTLGERWFNQEYMCSFEASDAQLFGFDVVMGALSSDVLTLFGPDGSPIASPVANNVVPLRAVP